MQAWSVCYTNSLSSCPNGSHSHRIFRASEKLQIVSPHAETTPKGLPASGILTHPVLLMSGLERVCFEKNGNLFFSAFEYKEQVEFPWHLLQQLSGAISCVC